MNDRRAALVEKVARRLCATDRFDPDEPWRHWKTHEWMCQWNAYEDHASAALDLALEEAAVACENIYGEEGCACNDWPTPEQCAAAIRALKSSA